MPIYRAERKLARYRVLTAACAFAQLRREDIGWARARRRAPRIALQPRVTGGGFEAALDLLDRHPGAAHLLGVALGTFAGRRPAKLGGGK